MLGQPDSVPPDQREQCPCAQCNNVTIATSPGSIAAGDFDPVDSSIITDGSTNMFGARSYSISINQARHVISQSRRNGFQVVQK